MRVIRVHRCIESDTLQLPELKDLIGKEVVILVLEEPSSPLRRPEGGRDYSALAQIAGQDLIDPEAYKQLRAASMI